MANVKTHLNKILSAIYGKEVRSAIHDSIDAINTQVETTTSAETTRVNAEKNRLTAENERVKTETERIKAENTRVAQEKTRIEQEKTRTDQETARKNAESTRVSAESGRVSAENTRVSQENGRKSTEETRVKSETERKNAETLRVNKETERIRNENERIEQEKQRKTVFVEIEKRLKEQPQITTDATLTKSGQAADAKSTGDKINALMKQKTTMSYGEITQIDLEKPWTAPADGCLLIQLFQTSGSGIYKIRIKKDNLTNHLNEASMQPCSVALEGFTSKHLMIPIKGKYTYQQEHGNSITYRTIFYPFNQTT